MSIRLKIILVVLPLIIAGGSAGRDVELFLGRLRGDAGDHPVPLVQGLRAPEVRRRPMEPPGDQRPRREHRHGVSGQGRRPVLRDVHPAKRDRDYHRPGQLGLSGDEGRASRAREGGDGRPGSPRLLGQARLRYGEAGRLRPGRILLPLRSLRLVGPRHRGQGRLLWRRRGDLPIHASGPPHRLPRVGPSPPPYGALSNKASRGGLVDDAENNLHERLL